MPEPSKQTDWFDKIPTWFRGLTGVLGSIGLIAGFVLAWRENTALYNLIAALLILGSLFLLSLYVFLARQKTKSKRTPPAYRFGKIRPLGLVGMLSVCLVLAVALLLDSTRQAVWFALIGSPTPTLTHTPLPTPIPSQTPTPLPTETLLPSPGPDAADVLIAEFRGNPTSGLNVAYRLEQDLQAKLRDSGLDIVVDVEPTPITSDGEAKLAANARRSRVVIWGWYDPGGIQAKIFLARGQEPGEELPGTTEIIYQEGAASSEASASEIAAVIREILEPNVSFLSLFVIGHLHYLSNNYREGHVAFDAAMKSIPETASIENQAILHFFEARQLDRNQGATQDVICEYARAIEEDRRFDIAYNNLGIVIDRYLESNNSEVTGATIPAEAAGCLERAGLTPEQFNDPARLFQMALAINPGLTLAEYNQYAAQWRDDPLDEENLLNLESIHERDPSILGPYMLLGVTRDKQEEDEAAIQWYESGLKLLESGQLTRADDPLRILFHHNLGQLHLLLDEARAEEEFTNVRNVSPDAQLALANLYVRQGKLAEASSLLDAVIRSNNSDPAFSETRVDVLLLRAWIARQANESTLVMDLLHQAGQGASDDRVANFLLGLLYQAAGQPEPARASFAAAVHGSVTFTTSGVWNTVTARCLDSRVIQATGTPAYSELFVAWAMNELPTSDCLPLDPSQRIAEIYQLFARFLLERRVYPAPGLAFAQCPFLYTEDPQTGEWELQTTILYKIVDHEAAQRRPLRQFHGRVLIREEEPEVSYLNHLYLLAEMADGSVQILQADVEALKRSDSDSIVLHQGEEILVSFEPYPVHGEVSRWWVVAVGYYSPISTTNS